jgi:ABC-type ATPase involved in cell division
MSLLELEHVSKRYKHGSLERHALRDVSLQLHAGELVTVWGLRRSGRSTLLRLAAGIEAPDAGVVCFEGNDLAIHAGISPTRGIEYCRPFRVIHVSVVLDELIATQLAVGVAPARARTQARMALQRAGVSDCSVLEPGELGAAQAVRVTIARALARQPSLLLVDEPTKGVELLERDGILALLRSLAREGIAILMCVGEGTGLFGADRALTLSDGELHGNVAPELAPVLRLPQGVSA